MHQRALDADGFKDGIRRDPAGPADGQDDIDHRGEFIGDRPFRGLRGVTDLLIFGKVIDFEDEAIDVVAEFLAFLGVFLDVGQSLFDAVEAASFGVGAEA